MWTGDKYLSRTEDGTVRLCGLAIKYLSRTEDGIVRLCGLAIKYLSRTEDGTVRLCGLAIMAKNICNTEGSYERTMGTERTKRTI